MGDYLLGDDGAELRRLGFQHEAWTQTTSALWDRAGFSLGHRILDLGSGPGFASIPLGRRVREGGEVVAVDGSKRALEVLNARAGENVTTVHTRIEDYDTPASTFDGVFARWVCCFLTDPEAVIRRAADWLKPGGTFALMDYFQYDALALAPPVPIMPTITSAVQRSWAASGGDLTVGGRLPALCEGAGLEVIDVRPVVHCARPGTALWNWPKSFFFEGFLDQLVEGEFLTAAGADEFRAAYLKTEKTPGAYLLTPPVITVVARKP
ncbi:MAG: methyltransferase domain-containing protein [Myxococcota bacterium]